jgi:polyisoprenoid-binding protein YceI
MRRVGLVVAAALLVAVAARAAPTRPQDPKVTFTVTSPAGDKLVGRGTELLLDNDGSWVVFRVPLGSITTGVASRDRQLRDKYLEVESYPAVELRVARDAIKIGSSGDVAAKLTLHGKTRDTSLHYAIKKESGFLKVSSTLRVDLREYGIDLPTHRGTAMKPHVEVNVSFGVLDGAAVTAERQ